MCHIIQFLFNLFKKNKKENIPSVQLPTVSTLIKKRALYFGINDYPGTSNDLRGCLNDVSEWTSLLKDIYKFNEVKNMFDSNCTREKIKIAMEKIIDLSVPNDVLVISYSGHGTYVADQNGDEIDGRDEAICLYDGIFLDDEIREIMSKIKDGVKTTVIFDSCFSGSSTRMVNADDAVYRVGRFMPSKDEGKMLCLKTKNKVFRTAGQTEEEMNHVLLSGCSDVEVSYDAQFDGKFYGALSYYATKVLLENPNVTYNEFYNALRKKLPSQQYPQSPQLEGPLALKSQLIFS